MGLADQTPIINKKSLVKNLKNRNMPQLLHLMSFSVPEQQKPINRTCARNEKISPPQRFTPTTPIHPGKPGMFYFCNSIEPTIKF